MPKFYIKQNDTRPSIQATLKDSSKNPVDLTGASVDFHMINVEDDSVIVDTSANIREALDGKVRYDWQDGDTSDSGVFYAEWEVEYAAGVVETFPNSSNLVIQIEDELA